MIQRQQRPHRPELRRDRGAPQPPPIPVAREDEPLILGFPAEFEPADFGTGEPRPAEVRADESSGFRLLVRRRSERLGGLALLLAAVAADASLWVTWFRGIGVTGLTLVRQGIAVSRSGVGELGRTGLWQPLVVVLGGAVLFVLGLLLFRRTRTHRVVGVLALLVALAAAAGVVVPLANANWSAGHFGPGMWLAVAVALLGLLGAMKAMMTVPAVEAGPAVSVRPRG